METNKLKVAELLRRLGAPAQHLKLQEEVKELTEAIVSGDEENIPDELADVGIVLQGLALAYGVDLEATMARKLRILLQSKWIAVGDGTHKRIKVDGGMLVVPPKLDANKPDLALLFRAFGPVLDDLARLTAFGEQKYSPLGWREQENGAARYTSAAMRHVSAHLAGQDIDDESGLPHLVHAIWSLMAAQYLHDQ